MKLLLFFSLIFPSAAAADFKKATAGWNCIYNVTLFHPHSQRYLFTGDFCIESNVRKLVRGIAFREKTAKNFSLSASLSGDQSDYAIKPAVIRSCGSNCAVYSLRRSLPPLKEADIKIFVQEQHETGALETYLSPSIDLSEIHPPFFAKVHDITIELQEAEDNMVEKRGSLNFVKAKKAGL